MLISLILANGALLDDIKSCVNGLLDDKLKTLASELCKQIGNEVRAELTCHKDFLMEDLGAINGVKSTVELCHTKVTDTTDYLNEILETINISATNIITKLEGQTRNLESCRSTQESLMQARTQLSSIAGLITENLKVVI